MELLLRIASRLDAFARAAGRLSGWIILPLIFTIMFDVITRKLDYTRLMFSDWAMSMGGISVSTILQDLQWHFHAVLLLLSFGFGYLANAHVRVDIFREMLAHRKQAWIELIGLLVLAIPFMFIMIDESYELTQMSFWQGEGSESLSGIDKRWIIKSVLIIGFMVLLAAIVATLFRLIGMLFGSTDIRLQAERSLEIFADESSELRLAREAAERALAEEEDALSAVSGQPAAAGISTAKGR